MLNFMTDFIFRISLDRAIVNGDNIVINISDKDLLTSMGQPPATSFFNFMEKIIAKLHNNGKLRTSETYRSALNSFQRFRNQEDICINNIDAPLMEAYEDWLLANNVAPNTSSFYMRILRATYHRAVNQHLAIDRQPFANVYTGHAKTRKRALPPELLRRLKAYAAENEAERFALDLFFLSLYTRGMALVDLAFLPSGSIGEKYIVYTRRKTGQQLTIRRTPQTDSIFRRNTPHNPHYALPIISHNDGTERAQFRTQQYRINRTLKKIARKTNIGSLTMYMARHSWASMARLAGVPMETICKCMGHHSERTTQIYLKEFDTDTMHDANDQVISLLEGD